MASPSHNRDRIRPFLVDKTFLGRLPDAVMDLLVGKGQLGTFAKGSIIYRRGDPGESLMVVVTGRVKLTNITVEGREIVLYYAGAGEILGDVAALDGKERAVDAVTLEATELFVICARDLLPALLAHPQAMLEIVRVLCEKLRVGAAIVEDNTLEMRGRTARGLLRLARRHGRRTADGSHLHLTISQEELGKYLGMTRANVNPTVGAVESCRCDHDRWYRDPHHR